MTSLREKMKQEMTLRGLASGTQEHYLRAIVKLHDHYNVSPAKLSDDEINPFSYLLSQINTGLQAHTTS